MVLYLIGLGLGDAKDISIKGLEMVKSAKKVFLECYTSILPDTIKEMEDLYGKEIIQADRDLIEQNCDKEILEEAVKDVVCVLIVGDVYCATTHCDLFLRAVEKGITVECIHNCGIMTGAGCCGLELYKFGRTVSIPFFTEKWKPSSFYDYLYTNKMNNLHTLCLLDIKTKEQSLENLLKGVKIYEEPRFMTVNQAIKQLLEIEKVKDKKVFKETTVCVGLARVGSHQKEEKKKQLILSGPASLLLMTDFGGPLHSLVVTANEDTLSDIEVEMINHWAMPGWKLIRGGGGGGGSDSGGSSSSSSSSSSNDKS